MLHSSARSNPAAQARRLTTPEKLIDAGLSDPARLAEIESVAGRYAIGLTPALGTA
jgi:hypothetical protein